MVIFSLYLYVFDCYQDIHCNYSNQALCECLIDVQIMDAYIVSFFKVTFPIAYPLMDQP